MTTEEIAGKLTYFQEQIHLIHWQTRSFAEHKATGRFYEFLQEFKDDIVEKLMGYTGKRIQSLKIDAIDPKADSMKVTEDVLKFSKDLESYGETMKFGDICNLAESLSGEAAKAKYLLTLS
jgi:DNA-binding ferritin-like protein